MIFTILKLGWKMLTRDRGGLFLSFLLPIIFFSIFIIIFGSAFSGGSTAPVSCIVVDLDNSQASHRFVQALKDDPSLKILTEPAHAADQPAHPYTRESAQEVVKAGDARVAAILPQGFGETVGSFSGDAPPVELLTDSITDPIAYQVVNGLMQRALIAGAPDIMIQRGLGEFEKYAGELTPHQRELMDRWLPQLRQEVESESSAATQPASSQPDSSAGSGGDADAESQPAKKSSFMDAGLVPTKVINVRTDHKTDWEALVAFQASATAVMFLLFAVSAGGGTLLEDQESGVLDRLLISNVGMSNLLLGKWLFIAMMGFVQVSVMFLWGAFVFHLELFTPEHLIGFIIMTAATACAASSLGIVLAASCKSRSQLGGLSTIVVLTMSAIGGSMFPRIFMSEKLQLIGKFCTFNAWALDGYRKVFYYNVPLVGLWPELLVLSCITVGLLILARILARRWEAA
ncbi:MAG TPA: ABC transporter permease [Phycisphaerales bacterium]|nr:ABC transporter permease [Phycisphaerales bacterium]